MSYEKPEEFDIIILGTGIIESIVAAKLVKKFKILIIDKNNTYGADTASLNYKEICKRFNQETQPLLLENFKNFSIDLLPKMILIEGRIQDYLKEYNLKDMINFVIIPGCFIYKKGKCIPVPMNEKSSFNTSAVSFLQKPRLIKFFWDVRKFVENPNTYKFQNTMREEFDAYGINDETKELIGHAICLNLDNSYLDKHPRETFDKLVLFVSSIRNQKSNISPYAYPLYGLSEFSQTFSRYSSNFGAICRLNTSINSIDVNEYNNFILQCIDHEGQPLIVQSKCIIGEPSYFKEDTEIKYEVIRCICIIKGDIKLLEKQISAQITFLASDLKRQNDILLIILGEREKTSFNEYKIAIISTIKETENIENELKIVIDKLGCIIHKFIRVDEIRGPDPELNSPGIYISESVDHTPSLETIFEQAEQIINKINKDNII